MSEEKGGRELVELRIRMRHAEQANQSNTRAVVDATVETVLDIIEKNLVVGPLQSYLVDDRLIKRIKALRDERAELAACSQGSREP